jgi:hypothetical protein
LLKIRGRRRRKREPRNRPKRNNRKRKKNKLKRPGNCATILNNPSYYLKRNRHLKGSVWGGAPQVQVG